MNLRVFETSVFALWLCGLAACDDRQLADLDALAQSDDDASDEDEDDDDGEEDEDSDDEPLADDSETISDDGDEDDSDEDDSDEEDDDEEDDDEEDDDEEAFEELLESTSTELFGTCSSEQCLPLDTFEEADDGACDDANVACRLGPGGCVWVCSSECEPQDCVYSTAFAPLLELCGRSLVAVCGEVEDTCQVIPRCHLPEPEAETGTCPSEDCSGQMPPATDCNAPQLSCQLNDDSECELVEVACFD